MYDFEGTAKSCQWNLLKSYMNRIRFWAGSPKIVYDFRRFCAKSSKIVPIRIIINFAYQNELWSDYGNRGSLPAGLSQPVDPSGVGGCCVFVFQFVQDVLHCIFHFRIFPFFIVLYMINVFHTFLICCMLWGTHCNLIPCLWCTFRFSLCPSLF